MNWEMILYKITHNKIALIFLLIGFLLTSLGIVLKIITKKIKNKIKPELVKEVVNFSGIFPGEKIFVWPVLNFDIFNSIGKSEGFIFYLGFDSFLGYLAKDLKKKEKLYIFNDFEKGLKNEIKNFNHLILFKKPKNVEFLKNLKNIKITTFGFELENLTPKKQKENLYLYSL